MRKNARKGEAMVNTKQKSARNVVVIGATGNIGRPLCAALASQSYQLTVFSRDPSHARSSVPNAQTYLVWSPDDELSDECTAAISDATAVVYLAGAPLFDGRKFTRQQIEAESSARAAAMRKVAAVLKQRGGNSVFIAASSVGVYGYYERPSGKGVTESYPASSDWWSVSSKLIEAAAQEAEARQTRVVMLRTGYVLTQHSLSSQVAQFRHYFGGWIGMGRGWVPWVHIDDVVGLILFGLQSQKLQGPVNATAPNPVTARSFAKTLGRELGHHAWLPAPTFFVGMGLGVLTDILVKGKRVIPHKALAQGYRFKFSVLDEALHDLLADKH
jgi:uncharacterized protein